MSIFAISLLAFMLHYFSSVLLVAPFLSLFPDFLVFFKLNKISRIPSLPTFFLLAHIIGMCLLVLLLLTCWIIALCLPVLSLLACSLAHLHSFSCLLVVHFPSSLVASLVAFPFWFVALLIADILMISFLACLFAAILANCQLSYLLPFWAFACFFVPSLVVSRFEIILHAFRFSWLSESLQFSRFLCCFPTCESRCLLLLLLC